MNNFEYHKHEIEEILLEKGNVKFAVVNGEVIDCNSAKANCTECLFYKTGEWCANLRKAWLNSEYEEPITAETLDSSFRKFCDIYSRCEYCEFNMEAGSCKFNWLLGNYNLTKKEANENDK